MRIISGRARGTKLYTLDGENTRPTLDRVKEPLFNILNFKLKDSVVLDLFAGSGALGLESISRGARQAIFCECNLSAIKIIKKNIEKTKFKEESLVIKGDFEKVLKTLNDNDVKVDIVFLDPPYKTDLVYKALKCILNTKLLNEGSKIVVETDDIERIKNDIEKIGLMIDDIRKYGRVHLVFINIK